MGTDPLLTKEEVERAFNVCDGSGSGFIAIKRLKIVMRAMGLEPRQTEVDSLIKQMQANEAARDVNSESFSLEELMFVLRDRLGDGNDSNHDIRSAFRLFDTQDKGYINFNDLKRVAQELGEDDVEDKDLWEMIHFADFTKRGRVSEDDFRVVMKKTKMY